MVHAVNAHGRGSAKSHNLVARLEGCARILVTWEGLDVVSRGEMRQSSLGVAAAICVILAACCDIPSVLYDTAGTVVCAPDGGFTGRGDGRCPAFISQRSNEKVLWRARAA